jgi:aspartate carbamoyltransferase regulatory subunit
MNIDSIRNGIVIDHIKVGNGMKIYNLLGLDKLECSVAIIKNVTSKKMGRKDIIKVDSLIDMNMDILGYIDSEMTINLIKDGELIEKKKVELPNTITNVVYCKNPRCITSVEQELKHVFNLQEDGSYRCIYCESKALE